MSCKKHHAASALQILQSLLILTTVQWTGKMRFYRIILPFRYRRITNEAKTCRRLDMQFWNIWCFYVCVGEYSRVQKLRKPRLRTVEFIFWGEDLDFKWPQTVLFVLVFCFNELCQYRLNFELKQSLQTI